MRPYKFLTGSSMGPLYKYLRYEILTNVGALTKVDVQDTGGIFPPDLINAHYRDSSLASSLDTSFDSSPQPQLICRELKRERTFGSSPRLRW
jgi:hypothetical protein